MVPKTMMEFGEGIEIQTPQAQSTPNGKIYAFTQLPPLKS
jgi:hypothetical protein